MNNDLRCIMFVSRLHFVVRPYGVYLIPPCSAFNEGCSTVENNYANSALIKCSDWYNTAIMNCLGKINKSLMTNLLITKPKIELQLSLLKKQCYCCDMWLTCSLWELSNNTWNDNIRVKSSMFSKATKASIHDKSDYNVLKWHNK